jgi:hypothetical protein
MGKAAGGKTEVTEYRMSIHFGVALKLDTVTKVLVDDKVAWSGSVSTNTAVSINRPDLFGGLKKEGGLVGTMQILMGAADQVVPADVAKRYGRTPETCFAFRDITTVMFHGSDRMSVGLNDVWDIFGGDFENVAADGFLWKHNSPVIAQKVQVEGSCAPVSPLNPLHAMIGPDANPIHMLYELYVDTEFGMSASPASIDEAAFNAAGETLFNESFGLTILWMRQTEVEKLAGEILDHIRAAVFTDPNTGLLSITLFRDNYDIATLSTISPDNAKLTGYKVRSGGEIINEISVTWTNPESDKEESITEQDIASIQSQQSKVPASRNYYGVRNIALARDLLARDLRESTAPLVSCEAVVDRTAWDKNPGDLVKLVWPKRNSETLIMRVGKVRKGKPGASTIRVPLIQDIFSLAHTPLALPASTGWVNPSTAPTPLTMQLMTLPSYFASNLSLQVDEVSLVDPEVLVMALADSQDDDSLDFELVTTVIGPTGGAVQVSSGAMTMSPLAYLGTALSAEAVSELPSNLFSSIAWGPTIGGFIWLGYGDTDQEIAAVTGRTATGWTIARGVLDTVPQPWPVSTPVWAIRAGANVVDTRVLRAAGETVTYRGLDRTSQGLLAYADAPDVVATLTERPYMPLRPANVTAGGVGFGAYAIGAATSVEIAWSTRNRLFEDSQVLLWTDGPIAPEYRQETIVTAYDDVTGDLILEWAYLWLDNSISFLKTDFDRYAAVRFVVSSRRDDVASLGGYSVVVTGFANNPAAGAPPTPPLRTTPPSILAAPAVAAFSAVVSLATGPEGTRIPEITVAGTQDRLDVLSLVTRYRVSGATTWTTLPSVPLSGESISFSLPGVQPETTYEVSVAYLVDIVGQYRDLADVLTGPIISTDISPTSPGVAPDDVDGTPTLTIATVIQPDGGQVSRLTAGCAAAAGAASYVVQIDDGATTATEPTPTVTLSNLVVRTGPTYKVRFKGVSRTGVLSAAWSGWSANVASAGDTTAPSVVTGPSVTALARRCVLSWTAPGDADYSHLKLYRNTSGTSPLTTGEAPYVVRVNGSVYADTNVTAGTTYHYWVKTVDRSGNVNATFTPLGSGTPTYVTVGGGDVQSTDPVLVTSLGMALTFVGRGALASLEAVPWGATYMTGRPLELTDGRLPAGLDASGDLNRDLTTARANSSDVLRRIGGGLSSADLGATYGDNLVTNALMVDGPTGMDGYNATGLTRTASVPANGDPGLWHLVNNTAGNQTINQPTKSVGSILKFYEGVWLRAPILGTQFAIQILCYNGAGAFIGYAINTNWFSNTTGWFFYITEGTVLTGTAQYYWSITVATNCKAGGFRVSGTELSANNTESRTALGFAGQGTLSLQNEVSANNLVPFDPGNEFLDYTFGTSYWSLSGGATWDTTTDTTGATKLNSARSMKSRIGDGTTTMSSPGLSLFITDPTKYIRVDPGSVIDISGRFFYKNGFTGAVVLSVAFYKTLAGTGYSSATNIQPGDKRSVAQVGDAVILVNQRINVPSDASVVKITILDYWSSILNNGGYFLFSWPVIRKVTRWVSDIDGRPDNVVALTGSEAINNATLQTSLTTGGVIPLTFVGRGTLASADSVRFGTSVMRADGTTVVSQTEVLNSGITISAAGALSGGGGGTVLLTNLGGTVNPDTQVTDGTTYKRFAATERSKLAGIAAGATTDATVATLISDLASGVVRPAEAADFTGSGPLATSTLTEAKVQGRYLGPHAGDAAAVTAGIQNGDIYLDTSLIPAGIKAQTSGVISEISSSGVLSAYAAQTDLTATSLTVGVSKAVTGISANSFATVWWTAKIEATPTATYQSAVGSSSPAGTYRLVETGSGVDRILADGTWSAQPGAGVDQIASLLIDGAIDNVVAASQPTRGFVVASGGSRTYELRLAKTSGFKSLLKVGLQVFVRIQRNT